MNTRTFTNELSARRRNFCARFGTPVCDSVSLFRDTHIVGGCNPQCRRTRVAVLIRVLGPVQAASEDGEISFRKAKSLELLCWLAFHRDCPTVSGARTALWETDVKDATFHNVLSELRHGLSVAGIPQGAGRISKHRLFLGEHICTDAEYLRECLLTVEAGSSDASIRRLSDALLTVRGLPFSSAGYAWADAEGITSTLVWRITRAVELVANVAAAEGNRTALLEAVAAGLRMSPGDEDFLALQNLECKFKLN